MFESHGIKRASLNNINPKRQLNIRLIENARSSKLRLSTIFISLTILILTAKYYFYFLHIVKNYREAILDSLRISIDVSDLNNIKGELQMRLQNFLKFEIKVHRVYGFFVIKKPSSVSSGNISSSSSRNNKKEKENEIHFATGFATLEEKVNAGELDISVKGFLNVSDPDSVGLILQSFLATNFTSPLDFHVHFDFSFHILGKEIRATFKLVKRKPFGSGSLASFFKGFYVKEEGKGSRRSLIEIFDSLPVKESSSQNHDGSSDLGKENKETEVEVKSREENTFCSNKQSEDGIVMKTLKGLGNSFSKFFKGCRSMVSSEAFSYLQKLNTVYETLKISNRTLFFKVLVLFKFYHFETVFRNFYINVDVFFGPEVKKPNTNSTEERRVLNEKIRGYRYEKVLVRYLRISPIKGTFANPQNPHTQFNNRLLLGIELDDGFFRKLKKVLGTVWECSGLLCEVSEFYYGRSADISLKFSAPSFLDHSDNVEGVVEKGNGVEYSVLASVLEEVGYLNFKVPYPSKEKGEEDKDARLNMDEKLWEEDYSFQ